MGKQVDHRFAGACVIDHLRMPSPPAMNRPEDHRFDDQPRRDSDVSDLPHRAAPDLAFQILS